MTMKIDTIRLRSERLKRAWSQEQLAQVAGLGLRTVNRIEKNGQCSLESLRAIAAAFDLLPQDLLFAEEGHDERDLKESDHSLQGGEKSKQVLTIGNSPSLLKSLHKYVTGGLVGALLGMGGMMMAGTVSASQVMLGFQGGLFENSQEFDAGRANREQIQSSLLVEEGDEAVIEISELMRVVLVPTITAEGVMLSTRIYTWQDGEFVLAASPGLLTGDKATAALRMALPSGQVIDMAVTPELQ